MRSDTSCSHAHPLLAASTALSPPLKCYRHRPCALHRACAPRRSQFVLDSHMVTQGVEVRTFSVGRELALSVGFLCVRLSCVYLNFQYFVLWTLDHTVYTALCIGIPTVTVKCFSATWTYLYSYGTAVNGVFTAGGWALRMGRSASPSSRVMLDTTGHQLV